MNTASQIMVNILIVFCFTGMIILSIIAMVFKDIRKKMIFIFLIFMLMAILSSLFYSEIIFYVIGFIIIFLLILAYLIAMYPEFYGESNPGFIKEKKQFSLNNMEITDMVIRVLAAIAYCGGSGYLIYKYLSFFYIANIEKIAEFNFLNSPSVVLKILLKELFSQYRVALIFITAALFMVFLWFAALGSIGKISSEKINDGKEFNRKNKK